MAETKTPNYGPQVGDAQWKEMITETRKSDTPRTDKHVRDIGADGLADGDFARQLERELAASQSEVARLREEWDKLRIALVETQTELREEKLAHKAIGDEYRLCRRLLMERTADLERAEQQTKLEREAKDEITTRAMSAEQRLAACAVSEEAVEVARAINKDSGANYCVYCKLPKELLRINAELKKEG